MKIKKRYIIIAFLLLVIGGGYLYKKMNNNLQIQCNAADKKIEIYQVKDNTKQSIEECWTAIDTDTLYTFNVGDVISLSFPKKPDIIEIREILLNPSTKTSLYRKVSDQQILYTIDQNCVKYSIPDNIATRLSSNPPEVDMRAYIVKLRINHREVLYTFLIKTNSIL